MRTDPVGQRLGPARLSVGSISLQRRVRHELGNRLKKGRQRWVRCLGCLRAAESKASAIWRRRPNKKSGRDPERDARVFRPFDRRSAQAGRVADMRGNRRSALWAGFRDWPARGVISPASGSSVRPSDCRPALRELASNVADQREHGTTGEVPIERFRRAEARALRPIAGVPPFAMAFAQGAA